MAKKRNDLPKLGKSIQKLEDFFNRLPNIIGVSYQNFVLDNFEQAEWEGKPWPARRVQKDKRRQSKRALLVKTGRLRRSIRYRIERQGGKRVVIVYSDAPYAAAHNEGLKTTVKANVKAHTRRIGKGKVQVRAHKRAQRIQLPERRFMGQSPSFNKQIVNYISKAIKNLK